MTNRVLVSVALRACNQGDSILQALESVMAQKVNFPMEIVCGVDLSTDNTIDIVRNFSGKMPKELSLKIIQHGANVGGANLMSILTACQGEYIAWLDGDDYWIDHSKIQKQVAILKENENIGVVYTDDFIDSRYTNGLKKRERNTLTQNAFSELLLGNYLTSETVVFRKDLLQYVDWDEFLKYPADDWFLWIEFSAHTQFYHLKEYTAAATINRTIDDDITLASLKYTEQNLPLQKYYIRKYPRLTNVTINDVNDDFAQSVIRAGIMLKDSVLTAKGINMHTIPKQTQTKIYYFILSHKPTFGLYMIYRKLKGKDNLTPLQRYFY